MKKILLLLFLIHSLIFSEEKDERLLIENIVQNLHIENGEIAAKVAFCREYGTNKHNYFLYGVAMQEAFATSSGEFGTLACMYFEKTREKDYCKNNSNKNMSLMWAEYSKWKSKLSNPLFNIEKGCEEFIPQINKNQMYQRTLSLYEFLKEKKQDRFLFNDPIKKLEKIKNLKLKD